MKQNQINVDKEKVARLAAVLKELNSGEDPQKAGKKTLELVKNINPIELSLAEQRLIEEGTKPEELRSLCTIHMEVMQDELNNLKASVETGHPLHTMIGEHEQILHLLTQLDEVNQIIQKCSGYDAMSKELKTLNDLTEQIIGAENHHRREEDALFPVLEEWGITGPTRIMRMEHDDLRARKYQLKNLCDGAGEMDFDAFKSQVDENAKYIVFHLRDHIFKENHILYPSAFETLLKVDGIWDEIKLKCDDIGYCSFTKTSQ